jgi:hypothetical protein
MSNKHGRHAQGDAPILLGDPNVNLAAPCNGCDKMIAEQVDAMALVNMSSHFCQCCGRNFRGRWTWRMRRGTRWVSSQCNNVLGRATNLGGWFWPISVRIPFCHNSDHHALVAKICAGGGKEMTKYCKQNCCFPLQIPRGPRTELVAKYKELCLDVIPPPHEGAPRQPMDIR